MCVRSSFAWCLFACFLSHTVFRDSLERFWFGFVGKVLTTDLYCKSTDKHQYLYHTNCHPKHTNTSLPYCLALHLRHICSSEKLFQQRTNEMLHHLIQRGYKKGCIHDAIKKASSLVMREEALADKTKPKSLQRVPFVVTYNPMLPNIPKILHEAHPILHASESCTEIFKNVPLVSYRRA